MTDLWRILSQSFLSDTKGFDGSDGLFLLLYNRENKKIVKKNTFIKYPIYSEWKMGKVWQGLVKASHIKALEYDGLFESPS